MNDPLNGLLVLDKPIGMTSMRAVEIVRHRAGKARTGHAGTLDPLATGVLILAIGRATKSIESLMATEKRYETTIDLSAFTETDDAEADRIEVDIKCAPSESDIRQALDAMTGNVMQTPPRFSAIKLGGHRSYDLARRGVSDAPTPAARMIKIHSIVVTAFDYPRIALSIHCDKGTYVRSIARELGVRLGTGGHCLSIRRTAVGEYGLDRAVTIEALPVCITQEALLPLPSLPVH
ncbi:MAG: tRNA pseudouridine(55) synthase TruB [Planctomycetota bacterium]|nr:tRNA pseudouridine(55) synthase TruB [Planctomycetota bacterium]